MLEKLEAVFRSHGTLRPSLVRAASDMPSPSTYLKHFGSMDRAFQQVFCEIRVMAGNQVREQIESLVDQVLIFDDFLVIDQKFDRARSAFCSHAVRPSRVLVLSS